MTPLNAVIELASAFEKFDTHVMQIMLTPQGFEQLESEMTPFMLKFKPVEQDLLRNCRSTNIRGVQIVAYYPHRDQAAEEIE